MKKFICTILIFLMLPITCLALAGCNNSNNNIKNFYTAYKDITKSTSNLALVETNDTYDLDLTSYKIDVDYTKNEKLSILVNDNSTSYYYLKHFYQQLLDDSLAPLYFFGENISNSKKVTKKQTDLLFKKLSTLKKDYEDIDYYVSVLTTSLNATNDSNVNLAYLKKLFSKYEQIIVSAGNLSAAVCDVYFGSVLTNSNINYSTKSYKQLTDADLGTISINTRARLYYYKAMYANIYNQMYVRNGDLAEQLSSGNFSLSNYAPYSYVSNIKSIANKSTQAWQSSKQQIYNNAVSLYHLQKNIDTAYNHFVNATEKVSYLKLSEHSTVNELNYGKIIYEFAEGMAIDSYEILNNLVNLLYI